MSNALSKKNFTEGPLFTRLFLFALPLMLSGLLQVGYNMADSIIVGKYSGDSNALAAVGSTNIYNVLIINLLLGFSMGAGVVVAQAFGAKDDKKLEKSIHSSMLISVISGVLFAVLGYVLTRPVLLLLNTKEELLESAILYMHILCIGIPANIIYNFGASVLRSLGDSSSSLYILAGSGAVNIVLNLIFVISYGMGVAGVAWATVISQYLSAILVVLFMMLQKGAAKFRFKKIRMDKSTCIAIMKLGLPAGFSNSLFSVSNMIVTSAFNTFPTETIYARTVVQNVDSIVTTLITSYQRSTMTFVAQNYGAGNFDRIKRSFWYSMIQMLTITITISAIILIFHRPIASLYIGNDNASKEIILDMVGPFFAILLGTYFICGIMNVMEAMLRGIKYSLSPSIVSIFTIVVFRVLWVYFVFPYDPFDNAEWLMASFPISWGLAIIPYVFITVIAWKKLKKIFRK